MLPKNRSAEHCSARGNPTSPAERCSALRQRSGGLIRGVAPRYELSRNSQRNVFREASKAAKLCAGSVEPFQFSQKRVSGVFSTCCFCFTSPSLVAPLGCHSLPSAVRGRDRTPKPRPTRRPVKAHDLRQGGHGKWEKGKGVKLLISHFHSPPGAMSRAARAESSRARQ